MNDFFKIKGKRDMVFTKTPEGYVTYDSISLEYYVLNEIGAEIMYCISKNFNLNQIVLVFQDIYDVSDEECREAIIDYLEVIPFQYIIYANLIQTSSCIPDAPGETGIHLEWKQRTPLCSRIAT